MLIFLTRHGQTNLHKNLLMQGLTDEPLNDTGIAQAHAMRKLLESRYPGLVFDAVYASPLCRAVRTGAIIGNVAESEVIVDPRVIETDFGRYEKKDYRRMGPAMSLYWTLPEIFPAPPTVESIDSMLRRSRSFLADLEACPYENVLVACHGGILRVLSGCLAGRKNGLWWRPKPHNCEIRIFETGDGTSRLLDQLKL